MTIDGQQKAAPVDAKWFFFISMLFDVFFDDVGVWPSSIGPLAAYTKTINHTHLMR